MKEESIRRENRRKSRSGLSRKLRNLALAGIVSLVGLGSDGLNCRRDKDPIPEKVYRYVDNSLENGFAFDFDEGLRFDEVAETPSGNYMIDAIGYSFDFPEHGESKRFTITSLRGTGDTYAVSLIEGDIREEFEHGTIRQIEHNNRLYDILLKDVRGARGFFNVPEFVFEVNGKEAIMSDESGVYVNGINLVPDLRFFYENRENPKIAEFRIYPFFVSESRFDSRPDSSEGWGFDYSYFSGLEHRVSLSEDGSEIMSKEVLVNRFNGKIQEDAYVRFIIPTLSERIKNIEKIRIPDQEIVTDYIRFRRPDFGGSPMYYRWQKIRGFEREGLESNFVFNFEDTDFPLEFILQETDTRIVFPIDALGSSFIYALGGKEKNFVLSYLGVDKWESLMFLEILEEPVVGNFILNQWHNFQLEDSLYDIRLRNLIFKNRGGFPIEYSEIPDFVFDVNREGESKELVVRPIHYGYPNRVLNINIDPDLAFYVRKRKSEIQSMPQHRFLLSKKKFSSSADFYDDRGFTGLKKVILPWREEYMQITFANRFNGEIQDAYFRVGADVPYNKGKFGDTISVYCMQKILLEEKR